MHKLIVGLFATMFALTAAAPAMARTQFPVRGFPGDATRPFECPSGKMLAGFAGNVGLWIDSIQPICAVANDNRTFRQPVVEGPEFGGRGGTRQTVYCPIGTVLAHVSGQFTANGQIASLALNCQTVSGRQSAGLLHFGNKNYAGDARADPRSRGSGFNESMQLAQGCSANELPTGFAVNFGIHVSGFGLICDRIAYPATPKAAAPPPAPPRPSGPTVVHIATIRGGWTTRTSSNADFTVILIPAHDGTGPLSGQAIPVTGQFINLQDAHDYDGTLQGVIRPFSRTLEYTYVQKNGASGIGTFTLSDDGSRITGNGRSSDGQTFTWNGTRAR